MRIEPHHRVFAGFFLFAFALGALLGRLPDVQAHLQLDKAQLGLTLIAMAIGSLLSLTLSSAMGRADGCAAHGASSR